MRMFLVYIENAKKFSLEAQEILSTKGSANQHPAASLVDIDSFGGIVFGNSGMPILRKGGSTLSSIILESPGVIDGTIASLEIIGECKGGEYVFRDGGQDKYESIYNTKKAVITDNQGNETIYEPPYMMGIITS